MSMKALTRRSSSEDHQPVMPDNAWTELLQRAAQTNFRQHRMQRATQSGAQRSATESAGMPAVEYPTSNALSAIFNTIR